MKTTKAPSCRHAFTSTLTDLAERDPLIYAVTSDARGSVTLTGFADKLPEQFVEVGIAEQNASGIAAGLALCGKKVFLCGPASFYSARSVEQIKNDIAYSGAPVRIVGVSGGVSYGALGSTHHSLHDIALFRAIPGISVLLPADYGETVAATEYLAEHPGPVYMRLGRGAVPDVYDHGPVPFELGKANVLKRGGDVAILATGETVYHAAQAAGLLEARGVSSSVVDVHTVKPLDREAILSVCDEARLVVTVEEHSVYGGLGGAVAELLSTTKPLPLRLIGFPDEFMPAGSSAELFNYVGISAEKIRDQVLEAIE
jgi:transketolase